ERAEVRRRQPGDHPPLEGRAEAGVRGRGRRRGLRSGGRARRQWADQHRRPAGRPWRRARDRLGAGPWNPPQGHGPGPRCRIGRSAGVTGATYRTATAALVWGLAAIAVLSAATTAALVLVNRGSIHNLDTATPIEIVMPLTFALVG